jgi:hypothetical protein
MVRGRLGHVVAQDRRLAGGVESNERRIVVFRDGFPLLESDREFVSLRGVDDPRPCIESIESLGLRALARIVLTCLSNVGNPLAPVASGTFAARCRKWGVHPICRPANLGLGCKYEHDRIDYAFTTLLRDHLK